MRVGNEVLAVVGIKEGRVTSEVLAVMYWL